MAGRYNEENEKTDNSSDEDSISLLYNLDACRGKGAAEGIIRTVVFSHVDNKVRRKENDDRMKLVKVPEEGMSIHSQSKPGCVPSSSTSAKVSQKFFTPRQLHKRNHRGETLLHKACKKRDLEQVKSLIQAGINVNLEDYAGWTALHEACGVGDEFVVQELLRAGANINAKSCDGVTPLHDAVCTGKYQVVMLLLQNGSNPSDKNVAGLTAVNMANEDKVKELLLTFQHKQPGATSLEPHCHTQLPCHSRLIPNWSGAAIVQSSEPTDTDRVKVSSDAEARKKDGVQDSTLSHSEAIKTILKDVAKKQSELMTFALTSLKDADEFHSVITQIQNVLTEMLIKQRLEKEKLAHRMMSDCLRQRVLKTELLSLASCQKNLIEVLRRQTCLVDMWTAANAQPLNQQGHITETEDCSQDSHRQGSQTQLTQANMERVSPTETTSRPRRTQQPYNGTQAKKAPTHTAVQSRKVSSILANTQHGAAVKNSSSKTKCKKAAIQSRSEDSSRPLSRLMQGGVLPAGSPLQVWLKGQWHHAHVLTNGSIKSESWVHVAPELWLQSILGNNIPVSSAYAWDKVMFLDRPLSYYMPKLQGGGSPHPEEGGAPSRRATSSQEMLTAEVLGLNHLMKIKIVHLVNDEERLPNALMDRYWDRLLHNDFSELEDWTSDVL